MFSVIIPTMWYANFYLEKLLINLQQSNYVGEIIIIDNNKYELEKTNLTYKKIRVVSMPQNIYVNEAWNIGVLIAKYDNICISNDDLSWDVNCLGFILNHINDNAIGMSSSNYERNIIGEFSVNKIDTREWGWGCCIFINKKNWIPIPNDLKIACGDDWIILHNKSMSLSGVKIDFEEVSRTSIRREFYDISQSDIQTFNFKYNNKIY